MTGDADFDAFVRGAWPTLRQAAYALTGDRADAEDLLQTVLTRTYARWRSIARDGDPVAYVRRGLVNAYVDTWRRRRRFREDATEDLPDHPTYDVRAAGTLGGVEDRAEVADLLSSLTPRERSIVVMRHYLDLPEREVAETLGCSVGTVKSTASRALQRLRVLSTSREEHARD